MNDGAASEPRNRLFDGLARHAVALISLTVAICGLSYNTWRNEATEAHRNVRQGAFMLLEELGQLQQLSDQRFFAGTRDDTNLVVCWGKVALVRDVAPLVSPRVKERADALFRTWSSELEAFDQGNAEAEKRVAAAIAATRAELLDELKALR